VKSGTPIVNPVNMRKHRLFVDDGPFLDKKECERLTRYKLFTGDIILGRKGDVGRAVFITPEYEGWIAGSDIIRVRLINSKLRSDFLYYFLLAPVTRAWVARHASGTTMPGINEKLINNIELPIPTPAKQLELVREFEQLNQVDDTLLDAISAGANLILSLANQLTDNP
jgi:type I restriction enzyme S subunit